MWQKAPKQWRVFWPGFTEHPEPATLMSVTGSAGLLHGSRWRLWGMRQECIFMYGRRSFSEGWLNRKFTRNILHAKYARWKTIQSRIRRDANFRMVNVGKRVYINETGCVSYQNLRRIRPG